MGYYPDIRERFVEGGDIMPLIFGTARYGADKIDGVIVPTPGPHTEEISLIRQAVAKGYNFIDTAQGYGDSERVIQQALSYAACNDVLIATKVGMAPESNIFASIIKSNLRLGAEPDVLYVHNRWDGILDGAMDGCLEDVDDAFDAGVVRSIGISNFKPDELLYAIRNFRNPISFYQARVNLHQPRPDAKELLEICQENEIIFTASSALDRGNVVEDPQPEIQAMAKKYGKTVPQLAIVGLRSVGLYPVVMTKNLEHMDENKEALETVLEPEDVGLLADILLSRNPPNRPASLSGMN